MYRTVQYLMFYGVFFVVLFALHVFVYYGLNRLFKFGRPGLCFAILVLLALLFPISSLLEKFFPSTLSMIIYTIGSTWMGVLFLLFSSLLVYGLLRLAVNLDSRLTGIVIVSAVMIVSAYALANALFIRTRTVSVPMPKLTEPVRAVLLSDIHVGTIHNSGYLTRIVDKTNALKPDVVFITGDFFDGIGPVSAETVAPLKGLEAGAFFCMGNHEKYADPDRITELLKETGLRVLRNEVAEHAGLQIAGVDFPERENSRDNPVVLTLPLDRRRPSVLLFHAPVGLAEARQAGIDLQVSGHTHAGQLFPFNLLVRLFFEHTEGLYRVGDMHLYVTPGTGTWGPPMRLGSSSEITLLNLEPINSVTGP